LSQKGKSNREIAEIFGAGGNTVNNAINRFSETSSAKNGNGYGPTRNLNKLQLLNLDCRRFSRKSQQNSHQNKPKVKSKRFSLIFV
jgi:transposase